MSITICLKNLDRDARRQLISANGGYHGVLAFVAQCMDENPSPRTQQMRDVLDQAIQYLDQILAEGKIRD